MSELNGSALEAMHFNSIAPYQEDIRQLEQKNKKLLHSLKFLMACLEEGSLVRNISKDSDPHWHLKMVILVTELQNAQTAIDENNK